MDNREFAEILLSEATEILSEATRYDKEQAKKEDGFSSKHYGNLNGKHFNNARKLSIEAEDARKAADNAKWYQVGKKKALNRKAEDAEDDAGYHYDQANYFASKGRRAADARKARFEGHNEAMAKHVSSVHSKINERAKKAQNECTDLAILLTEAALLLNEGAVNSDHKRKYKHNKIIADFEKSIERAREMGVPEDKILKNKEEIDKFFMGTKKS